MKERKISMVLAAVIAIAALSVTAFGQMSRKGTMKFKVRIENISNADGFTASNGMKWPFAISPGAYSIHRGSGNPLFKVGTNAGHTGLEAQAEDGNPEMLILRASNHAGVLTNGTFKTPAGASMPGPVTPGAAFEFEVMASPGAHLFLTFMFGQSNDLFFGNENGLDLFDKDGKPLSGDVTKEFGLWDAGTEVNEEPGIGPNQAPRQKSANTGMSEKKKVGPVKDGFTYPNTTDVLRITITPATDSSM
jgi:hypothetical protein